MSSSAGKTLGLVILIILLVLVGYSTLPFIFGPFHFLNHHVFNMNIFNGFRNGGSVFWGLFHFMPMFMLVLWIAVTIWVYRDAEDRRMNGVLWALLVFVGNIIGLLIYLILRNDTAVSITAPSVMICPSCDARVPERYSYCPYCGTRLKKNCPSCENPVQPEWKVCPHCGEILHKTPSA